MMTMIMMTTTTPVMMMHIQVMLNLKTLHVI